MSLKLLIIGGVAGGATAAARARRLNETAEIILFDRGEYISFANCGLPYYIGNTIQDRQHLLVTTPEDFKARYAIDIRTFHEVTAIDRHAKTVTVNNIQTGDTYQEDYDKLILSPGAAPIKPPLDGIDNERIFYLRNIPDTDRIKQYVDSQNPATAVIVGGGFIGLEMAENLVERGIKTTLVEMLPQVMPPIDREMAGQVHVHLKEKGVVLELENGVTAFSPAGGQIRISTTNGTELSCDMVIMSVGIRPENKLASDAGLALGERGGIKVDATLRTSDPDIFAVGDAVEITDFITGNQTMMALAGPANRQGRIAANNALGRISTYAGVLGTSVAKVFDLTVASTGQNEKCLRKNGTPYLKSYTCSGSHAGYYPGAEMMFIKLLFSPGSGNILGAQIIGRKGADKRIDVIATAIRARMTVHDLEALELAYAPPFSSAKDPVNIAGYVAANILMSDLPPIYWDEIDTLDANTHVIIDLRLDIERVEEGAIEHALHIPMDRLRETLPKLDRTKCYVLLCAIGLRGYVAHRILSQNGFTSRVVSGGYMLYRDALK